MNGFIQVKNTIKGIFNRLINKDFSGDSGTIVKNGAYQFSNNLVAKAGSLIFTIIIARLLMPELFGLYNLALSTILIFSTLSEIGIGETLVRYVSRELGKNNKKRARSYSVYLAKIKLCLLSVSIILLLTFSKFLAQTYYQKPIFLALIAGAFYLLFVNILGFLQFFLQASDYFKGVFYKEIILQISRIIFVPLAVVLSIKFFPSSELILFFTIFFLGFSYFLAAIFMIGVIYRKVDFIREEPRNLTLLQKKSINKFLIIVSSTALSGVFFSYVDRIMLGHFVPGEFIGYYSAAIGLIGAAIPLVGFSAIVLLPVFSRLKKDKLKEGLKKSRKVVTLMSGSVFIIAIILAPFLVNIVYGAAYAPAGNILRLLSIILLTIPLNSLNQAYIISKGQPQKIARLLVSATILNIILNYILISFLLSYGNLIAVYGAGISTIISQFFYLIGLTIVNKK